jgi:hypothetical protein
MRTVHLIIGCSVATGVFMAMAMLLKPYPFIGIAAPETATAMKPAPRAARPAPLFGADGTPQPALPQAVPADPRSRTQVALYATRDQAQALEAELGGAVLWVEAGCCDDAAVSAAIDHTEALRTERHLGLDAPVFVTGRHLHLAALVVDRLTEEGYEQVFLVTL